MEADAVRYAPHLFQKYIDKAYEVRVTVINSQCFAVRIDSQANAKTKIDWRNYDLEHTPHSALVLPAEIEQRILNYVRSYGLTFSALDFIVTPTDDWVFLENNPNGQWLWLEELTGLPMTEALISALIHEPRQPRFDENWARADG